MSKAEIRRLERLVDAFAAQMKAKLRQKADDGWTGWGDENCRRDFILELHEHAMRAVLDDEPLQFIDAANYAAFLWSMAKRPKVD